MTTDRADLLADLAREMSSEADVEAVLRRVVQAAAHEIEGAQYAGVTLLRRRSIVTSVATDALLEEFDRHQYATEQGPCLSAVTEHIPVVRVDDLSSDWRWPAFRAAVESLPVGAILSFQLYANREESAALNVYASKAHAFSDESVHLGSLLAAHAAVAAASTAKMANLRIALASRDVIGQAKGILMERYKITSEQSFDLLIAASQRTHRKLNDIAVQLSTTGELAVD